MIITSPAFDHNSSIPSTYTCDGKNISPPLEFHDIPENTQSLVLIMDDPDIPQEVKYARNIEVFDHWILFNIPAHTTHIDEGQTIGTPGINSAGNAKFTGSCPPPEYKPTTHRYFFKLYALDTMLDLDEGTTKSNVEKAMEGHIIEEAELIAVYDRT